MKKICFAALLSFIVAVPVFAQANAQYCWGSSPIVCQYLEDEGLDSGTTYWSYSAGSGQATVTDQCLWGNPSTGAADLDPGDAVFQTVDTDDFDVWSITLNLHKTSTSVTSNDYFKVNVYNYTTLQSETHYVYANEYSGLCGNVTIYLANNNADSTVRVKVEKNFSATATMYVDNISLWGNY